MLLRLPRDLPRGESSHVTSRRVGPEAPYGLAVRLASEPALAEALELARTAYDEAHEPASDASD